jgi:hydroxyacylglutathione hydrolase
MLIEKLFPRILRIWLGDANSNIYVIENNMIVDTGLGKFSQKLIEILQQNGIEPRIIVNTHCHWDHCGGNETLKNAFEARIFIHEKDAEALEKHTELTLCSLFGEIANPLKVDKKLKENEEIATENFNFRVIHTPGHTPGSICLYEEQKKILISGDTFFGDAIGRTELPGGCIRALKASLEKLSRIDTKLLLPGHGKPVKGNIPQLIRRCLSEYF